MFITYVVVTAITIAANAGIAIADLVKADFVLANSAKVDVPPSWLPMLGTLKAAGAVGLLLGLLGFQAIGVAAAIGLVAFYVGAIVAHVRAREINTIAPGPGVFLALAVASLVLAIAE
ncbi:DoxX family protein [Saccharopolyspora shandongensis]|uniref:DoxX family protein n=1 Tax=Saccharopolyspora shandongensis TaxID=418495 RepID=UPI0033EB17DB